MFLWILADTEVKRTLLWKTNLPPWAILAISLLIGVWVYMCYKKETGTSSVLAKLFLASLRLVILAIIFAILCEPVWREDTSKTRKSYLIFMVDTSLSMNIKDHYQKEKESNFISKLFSTDETELDQVTRLEVAKKLLENSKRVESLKKECEVRFFQFNGDLSLLSKFESLKAKGQRTDVYNSIMKAIDSFKGRTISAVYVLTDGQHNAGVIDKMEDLPQQTVVHANQRDIPIYTVGIGTTNKKKDIILQGVEAPDVALVDDKVRFDVELKHIGYEGQKIYLHLKWGDSVIAEKEIDLREENTTQKVAIYHTFTLADDYNITISIPKQLGEFTKDNNLRRHNIKIIKQKLQILYLEGIPRWEYRYLKNALIRDTTVLVNTWLYSADERFPQEKSRLAAPISGFPDTFEDLTKYHCVILGDIDPQRLGAKAMKHLVKFVEKGGGLVFLSGFKYNPGEYWDTPLAPLLPVLIDHDELDSSGSGSIEQRIRLTVEGKMHQVMRLVPNKADNETLWESRAEGLPPYYWSVPVKKAKPTATVLCVNSKTNQPLMATQFYGEGKTFFTGLDSSWRWRYLYGDRYFYRFWGQVIRHVSMGQLLGGNKQYSLNVGNTLYSIGQKVKITLKIRNIKNKKAPLEKEVEIKYVLPGGKEKTKKLISFDDDPTRYEGTILATRIGNYKVWFKPEGKKEISQFFNVVPPMAESGETQLNEADLKLLATKTEGLFLKPHELEANLKKFVPKKDIIQAMEKRYPFWDKTWIFFIILFVLTLEWVLRKVFKML